jgi:phosphoribosyl-AMP cyclohydrolase
MPDSKPVPFPEPGTIETSDVLTPRFDAQGLIAAIATDAQSGEVLMFAWMNAEALRRTVETGIAHFWSRSRARLWKKGEESGNLLMVEEMRVDCDQDAIWMKVRIGGGGVACHTGEKSCFYRIVELGGREPARLSRR